MGYFLTIYVILGKNTKFFMKKQKEIVTRFFNHPLVEAYLNLNQNAFKYNKIPWP